MRRRMPPLNHRMTPAATPASRAPRSPGNPWMFSAATVPVSVLSCRRSEAAGSSHMSRIDQALRNFEGARGTTSREAVTVADPQASPLAHYPSESASRVTLEEPIAQPVAEPAPARRVAPRLRDNSDLAARLVTSTSSSVPLEQYRRLAAVLHEAQVQGNLKTVMVTSALPGEGKSLTVANLAHTLSGSYGRRVLVIDADLRAPAMHRILGIRNSSGLGEALRGGRQDLPYVEV